ncbi:arylsulfotransferase [Kipferlia bialata]|uniref:Arylsulfotransferase n=1 Tax=Kipferlia bialata TaxID=797122 RepID=A0A9K3D0N1_9EUKA|nr:arylsulfotransferase [Kipferlia bialata]|eukprot:g7101.t1
MQTDRQTLPDFTDLVDVCTLRLVYTVREVVDVSRSYPVQDAVPSLTPFDLLTLGCLFSLPPIDMASLPKGDEYVVVAKHRPSGSPPDTHWVCAPPAPLVPDTPTHVLVIGMRGDTEYEVAHEYHLSSDVHGPVLIEHGISPRTFTAGPMPTEKPLAPAPTEIREDWLTGPSVPPSMRPGEVVFIMSMFPDGKRKGMSIPWPSGNVCALDLETRDPIWYAPLPYFPFHLPEPFNLSSLEPNLLSGEQSILMACGMPSLDCSPDCDPSTYCQGYIELGFDGNVVHEMTTHEINWKVQHQLGWTDVVITHTGHHDCIRLPNGYTVMMAMERVFTPPSHGLASIGETDRERITVAIQQDLVESGVSQEFIDKHVASSYFDIIFLLDEHWDLVYGWRSYKHIDMGRFATYNTLVTRSSLFGQGPMYKNRGDLTYDATHLNTVLYDDTDDTLVISARNLDLVGKIDVSLASQCPGLGPSRPFTERVVWSLRDFKILDRHFDVIDTTTRIQQSLEIISRQHMPSLLPVRGAPPYVKHLTVFSNNVEEYMESSPTWHGRAESGVGAHGRYFIINERLQEAVRVTDVEFPVFGMYIGCSQLLSNGNLWFECGGYGPYPRGIVYPWPRSCLIETTIDGDIVMALNHKIAAYRALRVDSINDPVELTHQPQGMDVSRFIPPHWLKGE